MGILKLAINTKAGWLGIPVGGYTTSAVPPPKDDPNFRYILCTAGQDGSGQYNEGVLIDESVTGTAPLIVAIATISLAGSPMNGLTAHLINTEGRFVGAGAAEAFEDDSIQNITGSIVSMWTSGQNGLGAFRSEVGSPNRAVNASLDSYNITFDASRVVRTSNHTQPRAHRVPHYMRIL